MDFLNLPLFTALTRKMSWLSAREKVLSQNVANVNTPNYKASDLKPLDFARELGQAQGALQPTVTNARHIQVATSDDAMAGLVTDEDRSINGNSVSMEDELIKVSQVAEDYQLVTNLYRKQLGMLKDALGRSGA